MSEEHNWKFAQCFGDKGDSDDITDGRLHSTLESDLRKRKEKKESKIV